MINIDSSLRSYTGKVPVCVVHPDTYLEKVAMEKSVRGSLKMFISAVKEYSLRSLGDKKAQMRKNGFNYHFNDMNEYTKSGKN